MAEGKLYQYQTTYNKFYYQDITIGKRNSIAEFDKDKEVLNSLWSTMVGDFVLDIGAGFGAYTLTSLANAAGFVFSFEQDRDFAKQLRTNLHLNPALMAIDRAFVCTWRLDDKIRSVDMFLSELSYPINRLDWIKIDLGSIPDNRSILWGCIDSIKKYKPNILINDPEPPKLSFLERYSVARIVNGHSFLSPIR